MNKFKFYFILLITTFSIFSCSKDDNSSYTPEPVRIYAAQYVVDLKTIENYLNTYYIETIVNNPGQADDQDIVMKKIPTGGTQTPIMEYLDTPESPRLTFPKLKMKIVKQDGLEYKYYYLILREGTGVSPCNVDGVLSSYVGSYLYNSTITGTTTTEVLSTQFEKVVYPSTYLNLFKAITGWGEALPEFKTGTYSFKSDGTISYSDFGAGVMFIPSGLAYYNLTGNGTIPYYSPLMFSFKLYNIQRLDQDNDGIPSYLEDLNGDGYLRSPSTAGDYSDDTDGDGIPNFFDIDDDNDNYTTRLETQYIHPDDPNKIVRYYPFNGVSNNDPNNPDDNPATPYVDESKGIPSYSETGNPDYYSPGRLRIHLDKKHHTAQ